MTGAAKRTTRTRRRPAPRGTLTRAAIVDAAFDLVASEGLSGLSMPILARRMGVGVTSLYWYLDSKDELLEAVADRVGELILSAEGTPSSDDWDERLAEHFREVRAILERHPGFSELVLAHGLPGNRAEDGLLANPRVRAMVDAGLSPADAVRGFHAVALYTMGYAAWSSARGRATRPARRSTTTAAPVDPLSEPSEAGYEFGLELAISSLRRRITEA